MALAGTVSMEPRRRICHCSHLGQNNRPCPAQLESAETTVRDARAIIPIRAQKAVQCGGVGKRMLLSHVISIPMWRSQARATSSRVTATACWDTLVIDARRSQVGLGKPCFSWPLSGPRPGRAVTRETRPELCSPPPSPPPPATHAVPACVTPSGSLMTFMSMRRSCKCTLQWITLLVRARERFC